jgi:hypothetical protein
MTHKSGLQCHSAPIVICRVRACPALSDLKRAIERQPDLKGKASKDPAFKSLRGSAEFKGLTKQAGLLRHELGGNL